MLSKTLTYIRNRWHPLWRLRQIGLYRRFQNACDCDVFTRLPGTRVRVALRLFRDASWIANASAIEPEIRGVFNLVLDELKPVVFWDVGANIGYYSWLVRQHPSIKDIVMFEPDPLNFRLINRTIRRNAIRNCEPMNFALADKCGKLAFIQDEASGAAGYLSVVSGKSDDDGLRKAYGMNRSILCQATTIDSLIKQGTVAPDLMKIDVEGAEHLVLAGAKVCLQENRPTLIIETGSQEVTQQLRGIGYAAFQIDSENLLFVYAEVGRDLSPFEAAFKPVR